MWITESLLWNDLCSPYDYEPVPRKPILAAWMLSGPHLAAQKDSCITHWYKGDTASFWQISVRVQTYNQFTTLWGLPSNSAKDKQFGWQMWDVTMNPTGVLVVPVVWVFHVKSEVGEGNRAERRPPPGIWAQHPAPAPHASHARHDRSMARDDSGG